MGRGSGGGMRRGRAHRQRRRRRGRPVRTGVGGVFSLGNTGHSTIDKLVQTARLVALLAFVLMVVGLFVALRQSMIGGIVIIMTGAMVFAGLHCIIYRLRAWALATNVQRETSWADVLRAMTAAPPTDRYPTTFEITSTDQSQCSVPYGVQSSPLVDCSQATLTQHQGHVELPPQYNDVPPGPHLGVPSQQLHTRLLHTRLPEYNITLPLYTEAATTDPPPSYDDAMNSRT
ncbi:PREDICTED: uncharacterized protein LOC109486453 isoform X1 [Branchiostoma belcheri]|uniref:Uncharacterized protein LOC109486453 isoform X1 n=1 Tax=Branchiostoma belcheri TaxID=7741 RepID=A0A6P4ZXD5_BRABE|nr:PREDICTED: uncharacterized protein LOC109486453 isoform X1 [Branchiostoma belcheri]